MMNAIKARMDKQEDEGFTLIELLVVVLIIGILMAIAIPTFLSLTGGAKTNAAEADLTTASQDAATYFTTNGTYGSSSSNVQGNLAGIDAGINYSAGSMGASGGKNVDVIWITATHIVLGTAGQDSNYYWVDANNGKLTYAETTTAAGAIATTAGPKNTDFTATSWSAMPAAFGS
jgi:type IV pilus assembly protein PilA